ARRLGRAALSHNHAGTGDSSGRAQRTDTHPPIPRWTRDLPSNGLQRSAGRTVSHHRRCIVTAQRQPAIRKTHPAEELPERPARIEPSPSTPAPTPAPARSITPSVTGSDADPAEGL